MTDGNRRVAATDGASQAGPPSGSAPVPPGRRVRRRRRWPRIIAAALLVGVLAAAAVVGVTALLPPSYQGRVALLALPTETSGSALLANQGGVSTSYGEVVGLAMPSIADLVTSPTLLDAVAAEVPGSPPPDELSSAVGVELLSGSGVARVSVTADDPQLAARLSEAVAAQVVKADLLAPAGQLKQIDPQATVLQTQPDTAFGTGLALIAGLLAAGVTVLAMRPFRPRAGAGKLAVEAVAASGRGPAALLDGDDPLLADRLRVLARAADRPVRVVGASTGVADPVRALQSELAAVRPHRPGPPSVLVVVDRGAVSAQDVDDALTALPADATVLAVVVV